MRKPIFFFGTLFLITSTIGLAQNLRKFTSYTHASATYNYAYYLPSNYDQNRSYPVLIGPGEGVRGSDTCFLWNVEDPGKFGWILVEFSIWKQNSNVVEALLKELNEKFNVEGDKFHIVGFSANSASCFGHVIANPDYFASITVIPGNPAFRDHVPLKKLKGKKIQNIVGENDQSWLRSAKEFDKIYKDLEIESSLEVISNGNHILNQLAGKKFLERMEKMRE